MAGAQCDLDAVLTGVTTVAALAPAAGHFVTRPVASVLVVLPRLPFVWSPQAFLRRPMADSGVFTIPLPYRPDVVSPAWATGSRQHKKTRRCSRLSWPPGRVFTTCSVREGQCRASARCRAKNPRYMQSTHQPVPGLIILRHIDFASRPKSVRAGTALRLTTGSL